MGWAVFDSRVYFLRHISIVETFLGLPPSFGVISSVPMAMVWTLASLKNRLRTISATSTAVLIARPRAFNVTSDVSPMLKPVMTAMT